ncbi:hypothetical protein HHK36_032421 [Tetracentron sinense]|uniref:Uncharacterized protein n=1 Tax=Tetracentron sinense TaxID=13715 RepID=A0A834Y7Y1_TETSI|nr:hypothetical protein HHK36_032421 [Tetracentron sinense]
MAAAAPLRGRSPPRPPDKQPKTFAEVVGNKTNPDQGSINHQEFSFESVTDVKKPSSYQGEPALFYSNEELTTSAEIFKHVLIAKFTFRRSSIEDLTAYVRKSIHTKLGISVGILDERHMLIRFESEAEYLSLWIKEFCYMEGQMVRFIKWTPFFLAGSEPTVVPIWITLPGLPINFFNPKDLKAIGNIVGKVLKVDGPTKSLSRPSMARVCIEIDVSKTKIERFWLGLHTSGRWQPIVYEKEPVICESCNKIGHYKDACRSYEKRSYTRRMKEKMKIGYPEETAPKVNKINTKRWVEKAFGKTATVSTTDLQPQKNLIEVEVIADQNRDPDLGRINSDCNTTDPRLNKNIKLACDSSNGGDTSRGEEEEETGVLAVQKNTTPKDDTVMDKSLSNNCYSLDSIHEERRRPGSNMNEILLFDKNSFENEIIEAVSQSKPNCPESCGNIVVPYPFGFGEKGCFRPETGFELICNQSVSPPMLLSRNNSVLNISLDEGTVTVNTSMAHMCYNKSIKEYVGSSNHTMTNLTGTIFTYSDTRNMLTGIGCDTYAYIMDSVTELYTSLCASLCNQKDVTTNGSCSGVGCCNTPIPKGLKVFPMGVGNLNYESKAWQFSPCIYAFVADKYWFDFSKISKINISDRPDRMGDSRVVLDWAVGSEKCESAQKRSRDYACEHNSRCDNYNNGNGYRCKCKEGYEGNPYLPYGCQDINECSNSSKYHCEGTCKNTEGNYTCTCPLGKQGDGKVSCKGFGVIPIVSGSVILLLLIAGSSWLLRQWKIKSKKKMRFFKRNGGLLLQQQISSNQVGVKPKIFNAKELVKATDHYNETRIVGKGGGGTVYKGMLQNGGIVAIKKSKTVEESQLEEFINEVALLSQVDHRNVVKLLGCCLETEVPLLVYEFVSNGTLFDHIHDAGDDASSMPWEDRLRIATEVAGALAYLHAAASIPIFHRDIKSGNILLDENYRAKVADFGISRSVPEDITHLTTMMVKGTPGYVDPEYFHSHQFTDKSDVYSFGVVLVELLTGERPISYFRPEEKRNLRAYFISSMKAGHLLQILDDGVKKDAAYEELLAVAKLAKRCLKLNGIKRPTMKEVAVVLEDLRSSHVHPSLPQNSLAGDIADANVQKSSSLVASFGIETGSSREDGN